MSAYCEKIGSADKVGGAFFGVCRGKASEGLDFADNNGRAVIITGLPHPPFAEPKVHTCSIINIQNMYIYIVHVHIAQYICIIHFLLLL